MHSEEDPSDGAGDRRRRRRSRDRRRERLRGHHHRLAGAGHDDERRRQLLEHRRHHRSATDNEGIAYVYHKLDGGPVRLTTVDGKPLSADVAIPTAKDGTVGVGTHKLKYWAQDVNGNVEAQHTLTFEIVADTVAPVDLRDGRLGGQGPHRDAQVQGHRTPRRTRARRPSSIKIKNRAGKVVKTINAGSMASTSPSRRSSAARWPRARTSTTCTRPTPPATRSPRSARPS